MAGGRLARTLRRDARRRSIFDHPLLPPSPSVPHLTPRHATNSLPDVKPPFQLANSNLRSPLLLEQPPEGCYWLYGVSREKATLEAWKRGLNGCARGKEKKNPSDRGMVKVVTLKRGTLTGGSLGLDILRVLGTLKFFGFKAASSCGNFIRNILKHRTSPQDSEMLSEEAFLKFCDFYFPEIWHIYTLDFSYPRFQC